ncbi:DUF4197 domain-containing protein [Mariprofundus sp. NF]|uniref:DUF4197 domain-containing protein n=1 Tax=Mariprofundus sp. NF TaxID=2608716 RepID=UPI0015A4D34F|nr:DUF4197 domain-containing protein [Mariprofundus sp. NF]NWF39792.1 DUF4197 domain-containing protein [Mariprofundus sp. NF]
MSPFRFVQPGLLAATLLIATPATAGWMDQLGGAVDTYNKTTQDSSTTSTAATALTNSDMVAGLKDALRVGSEQVVGQLSKNDGFNSDPKIHIPLPESMQTVKSALSAVGMGYMMDDLELKLNRAAEVATPKAKRIFGDSIKAMTISDAKNILNGPNDAATQYFKGKMSKPLSAEMRPVVEKSLKEAGAVQAYDSVMGQYSSLPFVPDVKANLTQHVLDLGLQGIFLYMAEEEAAIRSNPAKRTTDILKKVFSR